MKEKNEKSSPHILNASSNLLGLCFVVLTSLKLLDIAHKTVIDDLTVAATIFFMASCILSFLSIRGNAKNEGWYERLQTINYRHKLQNQSLNPLFLRLKLQACGYKVFQRNLFILV